MSSSAPKESFRPIIVTPIPASAKNLRSGSRGAKARVNKRIDELFSRYANVSLLELDPGGIEVLCSDMEIDHKDIRILILAWKMKAQKQGYFTQEEWRRGLRPLCASSLDKLKKALTELEREVRRPSNFSDFCEYAFKYSLTDDMPKAVHIETICQLLDVVLGSQFRPQVDSLTEYLKIQTDYKIVNFDQWMGFCRFCDQISFPDMSNYDPMLAWPVILDDFVEWIREKKSS